MANILQVIMEGKKISLTSTSDISTLRSIQASTSVLQVKATPTVCEEFLPVTFLWKSTLHCAYISSQASCIEREACPGRNKKRINPGMAGSSPFEVFSCSPAQETHLALLINAYSLALLWKLRCRF